jgi:cytochrome c2
VVTEEKEEVRYCTKCKKMETRGECSYGPEMWDKMTVKGVSEAVKDHEYSMARSELSTVMNAAKRLEKENGQER